MKKSVSQNNWLRRQSNDYYFNLAKKERYRSRAAYKLIEINKKYKLISYSSRIIDLGCSPGSWSQVAISNINKKTNEVISIDIKKMDPLSNCNFILDDIESLLNKKNCFLKYNSYNLILSDMAPNASGHKFTDQAKSDKLSFLALKFSYQYLSDKGNFVCKLFRGGSEKVFIEEAIVKFKKVYLFKPLSSRKESKEIYAICLGFNNLQ